MSSSENTRETKVRAINQSGIVELVDGTRWRVAPFDRQRALTWEPGVNVILEANDSGRLWPFTLTNQLTSERVVLLQLPVDPVED